MYDVKKLVHVMGGSVDSVHGDEHLTEIPQADLAAALDDVVQCIMLFGQYPQPRTALIRQAPRPVELSLVEFLVEHCEAFEVAAVAALLITDFSPEFSRRRVQMGLAWIEPLLRAHLIGSDIVARRAVQMAEEAREIAEENRHV